MKGKFKNAGTHIILIIASFISVFPLYWMIAAATNNSTDVLGGKLSLGTNFIQNLMKLTEMQNVSRAFCNSLFYSTILSVLSYLSARSQDMDLRFTTIRQKIH